MVSDRVENYVVMLTTLGEVLLGVINHPSRTEGSNEVHIPRTAYAGHIRAERLGDLHGKRAHASRRAVNQDPLPWLNLCLVAKGPAMH